VEGDDGVGLAVELDNGHSDRFSGSPGEATAMKNFGQDFGWRSSDKSYRPELYTDVHERREKTHGGGHMTWAPGGDGVPTPGPDAGRRPIGGPRVLGIFRIKLHSKCFPAYENS
jgi:hypothetical protein